MPERGLRIGRVPGVTTTKWHRVWSERFNEPLEFIDVDQEEQLAGLRDGSLDMCFVRLPIDRDGLHAIPLYEEVMVAWVSKDHAISAVDEITEADLEDEQIVTRADRASIDLALAGCVLVVPMSIARTGSRRDLTYRPIVDTAPSPIALAWRVDDENQLIQEFIGVVRGRTVNSSRGAGARGASDVSAAKTKSKYQPKAPQNARRGSGRAANALRSPRRAGGKGRPKWRGR